MEEDCFLFFEDNDLPEDQTIKILCINCHKEHPNLGWLWEGSKHGYGPFNFICSKCGHVIHSVENNI